MGFRTGGRLQAPGLTTIRKMNAIRIRFWTTPKIIPTGAAASRPQLLAVHDPLGDELAGAAVQANAMPSENPPANAHSHNPKDVGRDDPAGVEAIAHLVHQSAARHESQDRPRSDDEALRNDRQTRQHRDRADIHAP